MHTEGRESELLIALAQTRNELAREKDRSAGLKASKDNLSRMYGEQCAEVERLRDALENLSAHLDFSEPLEAGDLGIADPSGINAAFEQAGRALAAPAVAIVPHKHWPDCALNHGGTACDMGPDCGAPAAAAGRDPATEDADAAWRDGEAHGRDE